MSGRPIMGINMPHLIYDDAPSDDQAPDVEPVRDIQLSKGPDTGFNGSSMPSLQQLPQEQVAELHKQRRKAAFMSMLKLLEQGANDARQLQQLVAPLSGEEMLQVAEERALAHRCGNPLCTKPFRYTEPGQKYRALGGDITQQYVELYCCKPCRSFTEQLAQQLGNPLQRLKPSVLQSLLQQPSHGKVRQRSQPAVAAQGGGVPTMLASIQEREPERVAAESAANAAAAATADIVHAAAAGGDGATASSASSTVEGYTPRPKGEQRQPNSAAAAGATTSSSSTTRSRHHAAENSSKAVAESSSTDVAESSSKAVAASSRTDVADASSSSTCKPADSSKKKSVRFAPDVEYSMPAAGPPSAQALQQPVLCFSVEGAIAPSSSASEDADVAAGTMGRLSCVDADQLDAASQQFLQQAAAYRRKAGLMPIAELDEVDRDSAGEALPEQVDEVDEADSEQCTAPGSLQMWFPPSAGGWGVPVKTTVASSSRRSSNPKAADSSSSGTSNAGSACALNSSSSTGRGGGAHCHSSSSASGDAGGTGSSRTAVGTSSPQAFGPRAQQQPGVSSTAAAAANTVAAAAPTTSAQAGPALSSAPRPGVTSGGGGTTPAAAVGKVPAAQQQQQAAGATGAVGNAPKLRFTPCAPARRRQTVLLDAPPGTNVVLRGVPQATATAAAAKAGSTNSGPAAAAAAAAAAASSGLPTPAAGATAATTARGASGVTAAAEQQPGNQSSLATHRQDSSSPTRGTANAAGPSAGGAAVASARGTNRHHNSNGHVPSRAAPPLTTRAAATSTATTATSATTTTANRSSSRLRCAPPEADAGGHSNFSSSDESSIAGSAESLEDVSSASDWEDGEGDEGDGPAAGQQLELLSDDLDSSGGGSDSGSDAGQGEDESQDLGFRSAVGFFDMSRRTVRVKLSEFGLLWTTLQDWLGPAACGFFTGATGQQRGPAGTAAAAAKAAAAAVAAAAQQLQTAAGTGAAASSSNGSGSSSPAAAGGEAGSAAAVPSQVEVHARTALCELLSQVTPVVLTELQLPALIPPVLKQLPPLVRSLRITGALPPLQQRQWALVLLVLLAGMAQHRVPGLRGRFSRQESDGRLVKLLQQLQLDIDRFGALRDLIEGS